MSFSWTYLNVSQNSTKINNEAINELYSKVSTLRQRYGLSVVSPNYSDGTIVLETHLSNLRSYYDDMNGLTPNSVCTAHYITHKTTHYGTYLNNHNASYLYNNHGTHRTTHYVTYDSGYNYGYNSSVQITCVIAGTKILMEDGKEKNIEDIEIGEKVFGIDGSIGEVYFTECVPLGTRRALYTFPDKSLSLTGEHNIWIRKDGQQQWGVHNIHDWWAEVYSLDFPNAGNIESYKEIISVPHIIYEPVEYANIFDGWKKQYYEIDREHGPETPVYFIYISNSHTFIANGYVVGGGIDERDFDYENVEWDDSKWQQFMK
jgi:hypothetical protein